MFWRKNGKIIVKDGKVINCDDCPCGNVVCETCVVIPSKQIDSYSWSHEYDYSVQIAQYYTNDDGYLLAKGYVDDSLEVLVNGKSCYNERDPDPYSPGGAHSIVGELCNGYKRLCKVPKNSWIDILVWDEAYRYIAWQGDFLFCKDKVEEDEFE